MRYGLIGEKLGHSFSKEIHGRLGSYEYELLELAPERLGGFLKERCFDGINVTIPYKQAVMPYLDDISAPARRAGAVNTIVNRGGRLTGYNTDCTGMEMLIRRAGIDLENKTVLIAGSGGTSRTAAAVAEELGAAEIYRMSRGVNAAAAPAGEESASGAAMQGSAGRGSVITYKEAYEKHGGAQILINTTPAGMYPDVCGMAADIDRLPELEGVIDVVYNPLTTRLVNKAREKGIPAANGLYMLVAQAAAAAELFTGKPAMETGEDGSGDAGLADTVERIYRELLLEKSNIVLTGMPGSGKSTLGAILAERLGRGLVSTDDLITASEGMPVTEIFARKGESYFRDVETRVIKEASLEGGRVISTGGGAVMREENVRLLKMNGTIVFIDRPLEELLPSDERPLADSAEKIHALYEKRYPVYTGTADMTVTVEGSPEETADKITNNIFGQSFRR